MGTPSRERVTAELARLRDRYGAFDVRQTTLGVEAAAFDRAAGRDDGLAAVAARVYNDAGQVLLTRRGDQWVEPSCRVAGGTSLRGAARREVERATGVRCTVEDLLRVSIVCVRDDDDPDRTPIYRLAALFSGTHRAGEPRAWQARWCDEPPDTERPRVAP